MNEKIVVNLDDKDIWKNEYTIQINHVPTHIVFADCLGDAIDYIIDLWEKNEADNPSYFLSDEEIQEEEYPDEIMTGGNHGRYTSFGYHEIFVEEKRVN